MGKYTFVYIFILMLTIFKLLLLKFQEDENANLILLPKFPEDKERKCFSNMFNLLFLKIQEDMLSESEVQAMKILPRA